MSSLPISQARQKALDQLAAQVSDRQAMNMSRRQRPQRKQRKRHPERIPRPINCFLAYRLDMQKIIVERVPGANHRDISKVVAEWWRQEPEQVKEKYKMVAEIAKQEHLQMYPNYKYTPRRRRAGASSSSSSSTSSLSSSSLPSSLETSNQQHTGQQQDNEMACMSSETRCMVSTSPDSMVFAASEPSDSTLTLGYGNGSWEAAVMAACWPTSPVMQDCTTMGSVLQAPYYLSIDPQQQLTPTPFPESSDVAADAALHQGWAQPRPSTSTSTISSSSSSILSHHYQQQYEHEGRAIMEDTSVMPSSLLVTDEPDSLNYNDMFLEDSPNNMFGNVEKLVWE